MPEGILSESVAAPAVDGVVRAGRRSYVVLKRSIDLTLALVALLAAAPFMALIWVAIYAGDRRNPVYGQARVGQDGRRFVCYKFRTMVVDAEAVLKRHLDRDPEAAREWASRQKLRNDPRITRVGRMLRRWSLDELPQLLNIVRGDMSIVGPRPATEEQLPLYGEMAGNYLAVRPGLTGPWQVSGRARLTFRERAALDGGYVETMSFALDAKIVARTIGVVLSGDGAF